MKKTLLAISTLIGTIIGAGIFGIPYVVQKSGLLIGIICIILLTLVMLIINLNLGEIVLRTKANHQLPGYAEKYLGKKGERFMLIALLIEITTGIVAYLIGMGESLSFIILQSTNYSFMFGLAIWASMSVLCYYGIKALEKGEFIGVAIILIMILGITLIFINDIKVENFVSITSKNILNIFSPFGVVLFALLGYTTIPEIKRIIGNEKKSMKWTIIISLVTSGIIYILFTIIIIGVKGSSTPEIATLSLGKPFIILGILTMFTSYLALSIALIDSFNQDLNQSKLKSWLYTIVLPLILFIILNLIKKASFTKVLGIGGVISGSMTAILILIMSHKSKYLGDRIPEYKLPASKLLTGILIIILLTGTIIEMINSF